MQKATNANSIPVLMYHHVTANGGSLSVSAINFEKQMRGLAERGYTTLTSSQFADFITGKAPVPKKSLLITFDDGYLDNWVYAHPVLKRYELNAMLFAVTGLIGNGPVRPHSGQVGVQVPDCPPHKLAKEIMFSENPDPVMLRWDEIREMVSEGTFEIHSHTSTHKRWDLLSDASINKNSSFRHDLSTSRNTLVEQLGGVSDHFCWPQGYFDDDYKSIARSLGFNYLYTTDARGMNVANGDTTHIYRFAVRNRPFGWLGQRLWLATNPVLAPLYNAWKSRSDARKQKRKSSH